MFFFGIHEFTLVCNARGGEGEGALLGLREGRGGGAWGGMGGGVGRSDGGGWRRRALPHTFALPSCCRCVLRVGRRRVSRGAFQTANGRAAHPSWSTMNLSTSPWAGQEAGRRETGGTGREHRAPRRRGANAPCVFGARARGGGKRASAQLPRARLGPVSIPLAAPMFEALIVHYPLWGVCSGIGRGRRGGPPIFCLHSLPWTCRPGAPGCGGGGGALSCPASPSLKVGGHAPPTPARAFAHPATTWPHGARESTAATHASGTPFHPRLPLFFFPQAVFHPNKAGPAPFSVRRARFFALVGRAFFPSFSLSACG